MPPDLAVEVRSPTNRACGIAAKLARYRRADVPLIWWVDPKRRMVSVYRLTVLVAKLRDGEALDGEDIPPGFSAPVSEILEQLP